MIAPFCVLSFFAIISNGLDSDNYYLVELEKTRDDAATYCLDTYGTSLASVHCIAQEDEIKALINASPNDRAYIGAVWGRDTFDDGSVNVWPGNKVISGDCCSIEIIAGAYNFWNDLPSSHLRYFVCNKAPINANCLFDECTADTDNCDANADCTDEADGFHCECRAGFAGNGEVCYECSDHSMRVAIGCGDGEENVCVANTDRGSWRCRCRSSSVIVVEYPWLFLIAIVLAVSLLLNFTSFTITRKKRGYKTVQYDSDTEAQAINAN